MNERIKTADQPARRESGNALKGREPKTETIASKQKNATILLVDDQEQILKIMKRAVEGMNHSFREAKDGQEAWEIFQGGGIDLVVTDVSMPRMNGITLISNIKGKDPEMKIIIVTAFSSPEDEKKLRKIAFDIVVKPFRISDLENSIGKALGTAV